MSPHNALRDIEVLDEKGLKNFLRTNGMRACLKIFELERIDGKTFLSLSKDDFLRWKTKILDSEIKAIEKFLKNVKENPAKFSKYRHSHIPLPPSKSIFYFDLSPDCKRAPSSDDTQLSSLNNPPILYDIKFGFTPSQSPDLPKNQQRPPIAIKPSLCREAVLSQRISKHTQSILFGELERKLEYRKSLVDKNKNGTILKRQHTTRYHILESEDNQKRTRSPNDINGNPKATPLRGEDPASPGKTNYLDANNNRERVGTESYYLQAKKRSNPLAYISESKYYTKFNRDEAEVYLKIKGMDGTYLFRPSSRYFCALSILFANEVHHFAVKSINGRKLELAINGNGMQFDTLDDIVDYFNSNPVEAATFQKIVRLNSHITINK
ncbi:hypothetical protein Trydic_g20948 [Trypoxylus dichotomus]